METATVSWKCSGDKFTGDPLGSYGGGTGRQHNRRGQSAPPPHLHRRVGYLGILGIHTVLERGSPTPTQQGGGLGLPRSGDGLGAVVPHRFCGGAHGAVRGALTPRTCGPRVWCCV